MSQRKYQRQMNKDRDRKLKAFGNQAAQLFRQALASGEDLCRCPNFDIRSYASEEAANAETASLKVCAACGEPVFRLKAICEGGQK